MAKFHGPKNVHLGDPENPWAVSEYDADAYHYVVDVSGADIKKFRAVADEYGFVEAGKSEPEAEPVADEKAVDEKAVKGA